MASKNILSKVVGLVPSRWVGLVVRFCSGQGIVQILTALVGFLLVRWLTRDEFARYSFVSSLQVSIGSLIELGVSGAVVALAGRDKYTAESLSFYMRGARLLRTLGLAVMAPVVLVATWSVAAEQSWDMGEMSLLAALALVAIFLQGAAGHVRIPFVALRQIGTMYKPMVLGAALRLAFLLVVYSTGILNAAAAFVIVIVSLLVELLIFVPKVARYYAPDPQRPGAKAARELVRYLTPSFPQHLYGSFQAQLLLFLVSFMGTTGTIADIGALSRLGQLLLLMSTFNGFILLPHLAALDRDRLWLWYWRAFALNAAMLAPLAVLGFAVPDVLLLILGGTYAHLTDSVGLLVLASCFTQLYGVALMFCNARRYIYWWTTATFIGVSLGGQVACLFLFDLSSVGGAVRYFLCVAVLNFLVYLVISLVCLRRELRGELPVVASTNGAPAPDVVE